MKRILIVIFVFLFVSGCDDEAAYIKDENFQNFVPGEQTLADVKTQFPRFSEEFVWHSLASEEGEEGQNEPHVTLIYHTREGHYFMRFENNILIHKRKLP